MRAMTLLRRSRDGRAPIASWFDGRRRRLAAALAVFAVLTFLWNLPIAIDPGGTVLRGPADGTLSIRGNWITEEQGQTVFTATRDELNGAPEGLPYLNALSWAQPMQVGFLLVVHYAVGWIAAWNLFVMLGFLLTGVFGFALLDRLGFHPVTSFFGGYVLAFNPWMFERAWAGHAAFVHAWVFPALLLALLHMSRTRTLRSGLVAGAAYGLTFLFAGYSGLLATLIIGLYLLFELVRVRGLGEKAWTVTLACAAGLVCLAALAPGLVKYALDRKTVSSSIANVAAEAQRLGADAASYVLPSATHPFFGELTRRYEPSRNFAETTLFFGYTTLVLAIVGAVLVLRRNPVALTSAMRRNALVFATLLLPIAFWASLRSVVRPFGLWIPTLSYFVTHVTTYFRVYARFGIVVALALIVLAAPALERIVRRPRWGLPVAASLCALVAFELLPGAVTGWAADDPPAYDRWLARQPRGIVAHYPLPTDQRAALRLGEREIYFQMFHRQPLYNVFGAGTGNTREEGIRILSRYITDPLTPGILKAEEVRYVFVHDDVYREQRQEPPVVPDAFVPVRTFPDVRVYRLAEDIAPVALDPLLEQQAASIALVQGLPAPSLSFGTGFSAPIRRNGESGWRRLDGAGTLELEHDDPIMRRSQLLLRAVSDDIPRTVRVHDGDGALVAQFLVPTGVADFVIGPIRTPAGRTRLRFEADPPAPIGAGVTIGPPTAQPLSDFSLSLRATK